MSNPIKSFRDLNVYQRSYNLAVCTAKELLPKLPDHEKFDLKDQLSHSTKAVPRLIAEGYAKKHQKAGFQKYLDDALAECNESIVGIEMCRDIYGIDKELCNELVEGYDIVGKMTYKLEKAWDNFKKP